MERSWKRLIGAIISKASTILRIQEGATQVQRGERAELLRLGSALDRDVDELIRVVLPDTYKNWLRQLRGTKAFRP